MTIAEGGDFANKCEGFNICSTVTAIRRKFL